LDERSESESLSEEELYYNKKIGINKVEKTFVVQDNCQSSNTVTHLIMNQGYASSNDHNTG
jgi:hypothetical protein